MRISRIHVRLDAPQSELRARVLDHPLRRLDGQAFTRVRSIDLVSDLRGSGVPVDVMKTYHAHHQICPVWHQIPAHRSARSDLFQDARLGPGKWAEPEPCGPQRGRHTTRIPADVRAGIRTRMT